MQYYKLLQLSREPFSNSPDPDFFFNSYQHHGCLQKLELALRLKRGLNVVIGDIGTGKTTLCRQLIRNLSAEPDFETHLVLDPSFDTSMDFLRNIAGFICNRPPGDGVQEIEIKEQIKRYLFLKGVDQNKTIVLIIDEGQKISDACLEILRELLNYETNTHKLLQIVIFAQMEFQTLLRERANFSDRINLLHYLAPLNFSDTRQFIYHRLKLSSTAVKPKAIFTLPALWMIYRASRGYPRKIINICHQSVLALIIQNRSRAGWSLIRSCIKRLSHTTRSERILVSAILVVLVFAVVLNIFAVAFIMPKSDLQTAKQFKISPIEPLSAMPAERIRPAPDPSGTTSNDISQLPSEPKEVADNPAVAMLDRTTTTDLDLTAADVALEQTSPRPLYAAPPESLGQLIVRPGDTLGLMVRSIYGTYRKQYLTSVIASNDHIRNPDAIEVGSIVSFPRLDFSLGDPASAIVLIAFDEQPSLAVAMQRRRVLVDEIQLPLRVLSTWTPFAGLRFQLVLDGYFETLQAAKRYLSLLPIHSSDRASILSEWPDKTLFLSDPYGGGRRPSPAIVRLKIEK